MQGPKGEPDFVVGDVYHEPEHVLVARVHGQWNGIIEIHPAPEALKGLSNAPMQVVSLQPSNPFSPLSRSLLTCLPA
jgi:hypothetical protein